MKNNQKKIKVLSFATFLVAICLSGVFAQDSIIDKNDRRFNSLKTKSLNLLRSRDALIGEMDLQVTQIKQDQLQMYHTRVQQMVERVPVWAGEAIVHLNKNESLFGVTDNLVTNINVDTNPIIDDKIAIDRAKVLFGCEKCLTETQTPDLWVMRNEGVDYLVYRVQLRTETAKTNASMPVYFIDAHTSELVFAYDNLQHQSVTGTGTSLYSGTVSMKTSKVCTTPTPTPTPPPGGEIPLAEKTTDVKTSGASALPAPTPTPNCTYYLEDIDRRVGTFNDDLTTNPPRFIDSDNVWNSTTQKAGVDAHWGMEKTYDYFLSKHNRNGINGSGGPGKYNSKVGNYPLISSKVHVGTNYNNAYWDGTGLYFGDGDGNTFSPLVSIDVVGHEWTHGVTQFSAGLVYSGQSGALNESMSDVFGNMTERYAKGDNPSNTLVGEQITTPNIPGDALRNMADPHNAYSTQYDHFSEIPNPSTCSVHTCSGLPNKVYWLVWCGGTHHLGGGAVTAIGADKAEKIWYLALTSYMTSGTTFSQAKTATLNAATALYGINSQERATVLKAWQVSGI